MKKLILMTVGIICLTQVHGQNKLLEKMMAAQAPDELEFFADEAMSQPITSISDGTMEFFIKAPVTKAKASKAGNYTEVLLNLRWNGNRDVYSDFMDVGKKLSAISKSDGHILFRIDLTDMEKSDLMWSYLQDASNEEVILESTFKGGANRGTLMAKGMITLDLTSGNDKYLAYRVNQNSDFAFAASDRFSDDELKQRVVRDLESRNEFEIHQFAWGERVTYRGDDLLYYRRQSASMTFTDSNGDCYHSSATAFEVSSDPSRFPYKYENDGRYNNAERIPCDRVN